MTTSFTIAGEVASFDAAAFRMRLLARFPRAQDATVAVSAASIHVDVRTTTDETPP